MLAVFPVSGSLCLCVLAVRWLRKTPHAALTNQWTRRSSKMLLHSHLRQTNTDNPAPHSSASPSSCTSVSTDLMGKHLPRMDIASHQLTSTTCCLLPRSQKSFIIYNNRQWAYSSEVLCKRKVLLTPVINFSQ